MLNYKNGIMKYVHQVYLEYHYYLYIIFFKAKSQNASMVASYCTNNVPYYIIFHIIYSH